MLRRVGEQRRVRRRGPAAGLGLGLGGQGSGRGRTPRVVEERSWPTRRNARPPRPRGRSAARAAAPAPPRPARKAGLRRAAPLRGAPRSTARWSPRGRARRFRRLPALVARRAVRTRAPTLSEGVRREPQVVLEGDAHDAHGGAPQPVGVARARRLGAGQPGAHDVVGLVGDGQQRCRPGCRAAAPRPRAAGSRRRSPGRRRRGPALPA